MKTIGFIGGGRATKIFLQAFKNANIAFDKTVVFDINEGVLNSLKTKFPQISIKTDLKDVLDSELLVLAVHPPVTIEILEKIKGELSDKSIVLSLVPKITIDKTISVLGGFTDVARMNPSASSFVNKGVNPIAFSPTFDKAKKANLLKLLQSLGNTFEIIDSKIEAYAVISAMGHTYFNFQIQKLKELGVTFGMDEKEAQSAITEMLWGTTETLFKSGLSYQEVVDLVPVKPMAEVEETIKGFYDQYLTGIYAKIKP